MLNTEEKQAIASIEVYPGANADFTLFSDDGSTYAYEKGTGSVTRLHWDEAKHRFQHDGAPAWVSPDNKVVHIITH